MMETKSSFQIMGPCLNAGLHSALTLATELVFEKRYTGFGCASVHLLFS